MKPYSKIKQLHEMLASKEISAVELAEKYIKENDADALLLGCTEFPLMIKEGDVSVPTVNTTQIHIKAIYDYANTDVSSKRI